MTQFFLSQPQPCNYLEGRESSSIFTREEHLSPQILDQLLASGFRRSGRVIYRPHCTSCSACEASRVPVQRFSPSKSQRKVLRLNDDLTWQWKPLSFDQEHMELYNIYQDHQHQGQMAADSHLYQEMFDHPKLQVQELQFRLNKKLIGVSIVDVTSLALSSVYFYFDPEHKKRSLGTFSAICEINEAKRQHKFFWYIGYVISNCPKMQYKERFRPQERYLGDQWVPAPQVSHTMTQNSSLSRSTSLNASN